MSWVQLMLKEQIIVLVWVIESTLKYNVVLRLRMCLFRRLHEFEKNVAHFCLVDEEIT